MGNSAVLEALAVGLTSVCVACGGSQPEAQTPDEPMEDAPAERSNSISASAEIGALDEAKVTAAFRSSMGKLQQCLHSGAQRVELIGGEIAFVVHVGETGSVQDVFAESSSLGDRETEVCMFNVLRSATWPAPVGGLVGIAKNSFDFDMPNDERPPEVWESDRVSSAVSQLGSEIDRCKNGASGQFVATLYVDTEGKAVSASVTPPDAEGEQAVDCLVEVLKTAQYDSPGSWPAKVMFGL